MPHGHITSLAVLRTYRKCGIATKLMQASRKSQEEGGREAREAREGRTYHPIDIRTLKFTFIIITNIRIW